MIYVNDQPDSEQMSADKHVHTSELWQVAMHNMQFKVTYYVLRVGEKIYPLVLPSMSVQADSCQTRVTSMAIWK